MKRIIEIVIGGLIFQAFFVFAYIFIAAYLPGVVDFLKRFMRLIAELLNIIADEMEPTVATLLHLL